MNDTRYMISETAKITQVEPHVLRYWEEELGLAIKRNEMGHRYYTEKDIQTFMDIKELKKKGMQLRAIREIINSDKQNDEQQESGIQEAACAAPVQKKGESREMQVSCSLGKSVEQRFGEIMERLIHDIELDERKEGRYRRLDEAIRRCQQTRKMAAITQEHSVKKKKRKK